MVIVGLWRAWEKAWTSSKKVTRWSQCSWLSAVIALIVANLKATYAPNLSLALNRECLEMGPQGSLVLMDLLSTTRYSSLVSWSTLWLMLCISWRWTPGSHPRSLVYLAVGSLLVWILIFTPVKFFKIHILFRRKLVFLTVRTLYTSSHMCLLLPPIFF